MKKNALTLDQVVYSALRSDFEEERQHVDAVLSFYDETKAQVIYSVSCHKIALSAKSTLLRQLLIDHQVGGRGRVKTLNFLISICFTKLSEILYFPT